MPDRPNPITPGHAARILARAAIIDNREPAAAADEVWASALTSAGVDYRDCLAAVDLHYAESTERIMPAHVITIARGIRRERAERDRTAEHLALTAGRPEAGSPEAMAVLDRLSDTMRRDTVARNAVMSQPEERPCIVVRAGQPCAGTVRFEPQQMSGTCDTCGTRPNRFASGYTMSERRAGEGA